MEMRKCETCGEMYSTTYRTCPFCEEEEAMRKGKPMHRHASDFRNKRGGHALGVLALVLALVLVGGGGWMLFGDSISSMIGIRETSGISDGQDPDAGEETGEGTDAPSGGNVTTAPLTLDQSSLALEAGATGSLTASGGGESYTWSSDNAEVASVDENGSVTAVAEGEAVISVTDGTSTVQCTVQVTAAETGGETGSGAGNGTLTLNRDDFTMGVGETWQLKVSGTSASVTWSIENRAVATIAADGTVTGVSSGVTTAYAKVDGQTLECIVRIK